MKANQFALSTSKKRKLLKEKKVNKLTQYVKVNFLMSLNSYIINLKFNELILSKSRYSYEVF
jgi:hypothetical protein